jgi:peptidylprolyl isomerase
MLSLIAALALQNPAYNPKGPTITFTMQGGKTFMIATDPAASPKTVAHILKLVKNGFYSRQRIHRVESWVTQWGAPASRTKKMDDPAVLDGGSMKGELPFEMSEVDFTRGVVGVASEGLQRGGDSQLFVLKKDWLRLYHSYAVVGKVVSGMNVVDAIKRGDRIIKAEIRPVTQKR